MLYYSHGTSCLLGGLTFILTMEVMFMKNKQFDFKDLMAFGSFILALLAFIFANVWACNLSFYIEKPPSWLWRALGWFFYLNNWSTHLVGECSFYILILTQFCIYYNSFFIPIIKQTFFPNPLCQWKRQNKPLKLSKIV